MAPGASAPTAGTSSSTPGDSGGHATPAPAAPTTPATSTANHSASSALGPGGDSGDSAPAATPQETSAALAHELATEKSQPTANTETAKVAPRASPTAEASLAVMSHVRVQIPGYSRIKHAVMIPDDVVLDVKAMRRILEAAGVKHPYTLIQGCCGDRDPDDMLTDVEAGLEQFKGLISDKSSTPDTAMMNQVLLNKCSEIMFGFNNALQESNGMCFHRNCMGLYENVVERLKRGRGLHETTMAVMHLNSKAITSEHAKKIADVLLQEVDARNKLGLVQDGTECPLTGFPESAVIELSKGNKELPAFATDVFLCFYKPDGVHRDRASKELVDVSTRRQFDERCTGSTLAFIFMNGSRKEKEQFLMCCENGDPSVIIKNTGGVAAQMAELFDIIIDITELSSYYMKPDKLDRLSKLLDDKCIENDQMTSEKDQSTTKYVWKLSLDKFSPMTLEERVAKLSPKRIRIHLLQQCGQQLQLSLERSRTVTTVVRKEVPMPDGSVGIVEMPQVQEDAAPLPESAAATSDDGHDFSIPDIIRLLDIAKMRNHKFSSTIRVIDPLKDTPEQAMMALSGCLDSTDIGPMEIGANDATSAVVTEAWCYHKIIMQKLDEVSARFTRLTVSAAALMFGATSCSVILQLVKRVEGWEDCVKVGRAVVIVVPLAVSFLTTIISSFQMGTQKAKLVLAGAELTSEIFQYRAHVGRYSLTGVIEGDSSDSDDNPQSSTGLRHTTRMMFVKRVNQIFVDAAGSMNDDTLLGFDIADMKKGEHKTMMTDYMRDELPWRLYGVGKDGGALPSTENTMVSVFCWLVSCCFCDGRNSYEWCRSCKQCLDQWSNCVCCFPYKWCSFCSWLCRKAHWCRWCRIAIYRRFKNCWSCLCSELPDPETGHVRGRSQAQDKSKAKPKTSQKKGKGKEQPLLDPPENEEEPQDTGVTYLTPSFEWKQVADWTKLGWLGSLMRPSKAPYPECTPQSAWYSVPKPPAPVSYAAPVYYAAPVSYAAPAKTDSFVSHMNSTDYFDLRVLPSIRRLAGECPTMARSLKVSQILIFLSGIVASILGAMDSDAFNFSSLIPIVMGFSTLVSTMLHFNGFSTRLVATNTAISLLQAKRTAWKGQGSFDRRSEKAKRDLIEATEHVLLDVAKAVAAVSAAATGSDKGTDDADQTGTTVAKPGAKAKAKGKAKASATT